MSPEKSWAIVVVAAIALVVFDVIGRHDSKWGNTPREVLRHLLDRFHGTCWIGLIPFAFGVLAGHFFHPWGQPLFWLKLPVSIGICLATGILLSLVRRYTPIKLSYAALLICGVATGVVVWPVCVGPQCEEEHATTGQRPRSFNLRQRSSGGGLTPVTREAPRPRSRLQEWRQPPRPDCSFARLQVAS